MSFAKNLYEEILFHIFSNAVKFSPMNRKILVKVENQIDEAN